MSHETALIATLAIGLTLALVLGYGAVRLRMPPLVGYLLAGVLVGPFTPGFVADVRLAPQLAEVGVILLMFGVGMHVSPRDLLAVRKIAVPGALLGIFASTLAGVGLARVWDGAPGSGLVFGLALSVASTVVLVQALERSGRLESEEGRLAMGWLVVEDVAMVLVLVLLPVLSPALGGRALGPPPREGLGLTLLGTIVKIVVFATLMLVVGSRAFPWLLRRVERTGSRELFSLAVVASALGVAFGAAELFGVSFALGAFLAGVVLHESELRHRAALEALPLRDAFAALFFVSVGMLFDPSVLLREPLRLLAVLAVIVFLKPAAAAGITLAFGKSKRTALAVGVRLAQIGEFSFILAGLGVTLGLLNEEGHTLVLAGALVSIVLNPLLVAMEERVREPRASG